MADPGRDQGSAMERLMRLAIYLADYPRYGVTGGRLADVAGYQRDTSGLSALRRDIRRLRDAGWDIESVGGDGFDGQYLLKPGDNRLAVTLTPGERQALEDAAADLGRQLSAPAECLGMLQRAAERHCLVRFTYHGKSRVVHPYTLHSGPSGWSLRGREVDGTITKTFVVERMDDDVRIDVPGTAETVSTVVHRGHDPMTWDVDPLTQVELITTAEHRRSVLNAMAGAVEQHATDDRVVIMVPVTNRAAFRDRLYGLGVRARVSGPPEIRSMIIEDLRAHVAAVS